MKLIKPLSVLILITSALLLSAANKNSETPKAQPNQNAHAQSPTQQHSPPSDLPVTATLQVTGTPTASHRESNTYNYYYPAKDGWNWSGIIEAVATLGLLGFALWQMDFVRRSTKATETAAQAASDNAKAAKDAAIATERYVGMTEQLVETTKQTAQIARLALDIERPYVIIESQSLSTRNIKGGSGSTGKFAALLLTTREVDNEADADYKQISLTFALKNRGRSVAIIGRPKFRIIEMPTARLIGGVLVPTGRFRVIGRNTLFAHESIIDRGETVTCETFGLAIPMAQWQRVWTAGQTLSVLVRVSYMDTTERRFPGTQRFIWAVGNDRLFVSPRPHNPH
jgi:hypothetical protein